MRIGRRDKKRTAQNYAITSAPKPLSQDIRSRESKYLMAMSIRVVAFILIVTLPISWVWKIGLAAVALIIPYVAVVYANGGREKGSDTFDRYQNPVHQAITRGVPETEAEHPSEPLVGTIVDDTPDRTAADPEPARES